MPDTALSSLSSLVLIGAGKMGGAMLEGWLRGGLRGEAVAIYDPALAEDAPHPLRSTCQTSGVAINPTDVASVAPDVIVLAVKPQIMAAALEQYKGLAGDHTLIVSVAAGWTVENFESVFGRDASIVRVMPNTPAAIGRGMLVGYASGAVSDAQRQTADQLMKAVGETAWLDEEVHMDAVTAVSGSGPAYVFYLVECLEQAAKDAGLSNELAGKLARATVSGAGALLDTDPLPASKLRENVTSPNGTTAAALEVLMSADGLQQPLTDAVLAAKARSEELGQ